MERDRFRNERRAGIHRLGKEFDLFTLFVDNIPTARNQSWLETLFSNYGIVRDSFIPAKRSKRGSKFGFVRYDCSVSAAVAISRANGLEVEGNYLFVKKASFNLENKRRSDDVDSSKPIEDCRQKNMELRVDDGISYAQALKGGVKHGNMKNSGSILVQPMGNGWLYRSAIGKIHKLISSEDLENIFKMEQIRDVQIRAIGGRFVIVTFPNEESRNATIKERRVTNWLEDIKPWNGEQAKDERFVWLSCFGMPLNAWSMQTFKDIGGKWGHFLKVDDNTLSGKSYEKGKVLIATEHIHKVEGYMELVVDGLSYSIRVEEEESFRKIASSNSLIDQEIEVDKKDVVLDQKSDDVNRGSVDLVANNDVVDAHSKMGWPDIALDQNHAIPANHLKDYGEGSKPLEEDHIQDSMTSSNMAQNKSKVGIQDKLKNGDEEGNKSTKGTTSVIPETQEDGYINELGLEGDKYTASSGEKVMNEEDDLEFGNSLEDLNLNHNVSSDPIEDNHSPIQAAVKGIKGKKRRKNIDEVLGFSKVNNRNHKGGKNKNKCVVFRSAVAAAALNASVSSEGIINRNRILLDEARTIWTVNKIFEIGYDGPEDEVVSKITEMEALRNESSVSLEF